jgi:transmembrane sensor
MDIIRCLQGHCTPEEEEALRRWRQQSLQNERHYRETVRAWKLAALAEPPAASTPPPRFELPRSSRYAGRKSLARRFTGRRNAVVPLTAAATLALGVGIGVFWASERAVPGLAAEEFITGPHEMVTTRLSDGTVVRLAPQSRLRVTDGDPKREVWLDGHAFFAVARNGGRRFTVRTRAGDAVVHGTRFDVQVEADVMQVFVVEGRVAHHAAGHEVEVGAMQLSRVTEGGAPKVEAIEDAEPLLSWLGEFLVFQSTPISDVARELERRFGVQVRVADAAVATRTVTAWFTNENLEQVLLIVCRAADARCLIRDRIVSIEP